MSEPLKNIAFVGASGYLGQSTLKALVASGKHNITVISRSSSTSSIPKYDGVTVASGEYDDESFMQSTLHGQDILIIMLAFLALPAQDTLLQAAAAAGVPYVIPSEYMMDASQPQLCDAVPLIRKCRHDHARIQQLGMKFIAVVCNLWIDFTLRRGMAGVDCKSRTATICSDSARYNTTTTTQVGNGIAAMLALPRSVIDERFANSTLYLSSFELTHEELFRAVLQADGSSESDWTVERQTCDDLLDEGRQKLAGGDRSGMIDLFVGSMLKPGFGGSYSEKAHNDFLQLPQENLLQTVRAAIAAA